MQNRSDKKKAAECTAHRTALPVNPYLDSATKRVFDIFGAIAIGLALFPFVCVVVLILFLRPGSIFYQHERIGRFGKTFCCIKFRTMVVDAEVKLQEFFNINSEAKIDWDRERKIKNDPRVTRVGKYLRKSSLDELPQLLNVLMGDMSLVGPRPVVLEEINKYGSSSLYYEACKPGLTGLWQVSGRSNVRYSRRVAMDRVYSCRANLGLDIIIILKTVIMVVRGKGAY